MRNRTNRIALAATAVLAVVALAAPLAAFAVPGKNAGNKPMLSAPSGSGGTTPASKEQKLENLKQRIANVLAARKARFDAAVKNLNSRIDRVSAIADKVETAGGDVSSARASLDAAKAHIAKAESLEAETIAAFEAIPSASNRGVAFKAARAKGKLTNAELKAGRVDIRTAARTLRTIVSQLKSQ